MHKDCFSSGCRGKAMQTNGFNDTNDQLSLDNRLVSHCKKIGQMVLIRVLMIGGLRRINRQGKHE